MNYLFNTKFIRFGLVSAISLFFLLSSGVVLANYATAEVCYQQGRTIIADATYVGYVTCYAPSLSLSVPIYEGGYENREFINQGTYRCFFVEPNGATPVLKGQYEGNFTYTRAKGQGILSHTESKTSSVKDDWDVDVVGLCNLLDALGTPTPPPTPPRSQM